MGNYTIFQKFENPRRGRQARNFTTNVPKILDLKLSSEQIFSENWRWVPPIISICFPTGLNSKLHLFPPHHRMFQWLRLLPYLNLPYIQASDISNSKRTWYVLGLSGFDLYHPQTARVPITRLLWLWSNQSIWKIRHFQGTNQQNIQILDVLV